MTTTASLPSIAPILQPPVFLTAEWRWLAMFNFEVDPELLLPYVPQGTELDLWQGRALISLVAFRFLNTRVLGWSIPGHRDFSEVNLRFYVRRGTSTGYRRGVVFLKEVVPRWAVAFVARWIYNENYVTMPVCHELQFPAAGDPGQPAPDGSGRGCVRYRWGHGKAKMRLGVTVAGSPQPLLPGSEEEFITEHYWGYVRQRDGSTLEYAVEHPRWNVWPAYSVEIGGDPAPIYGDPWATALSKLPCSAFLVDGSAVSVRRGVLLPR